MRTILRFVLVFLVLAPLCRAAVAAGDGSQLPLPSGVDVGLVVFEDLQCPDCAHAHPMLLEAAKAANVPLIVHDFPISRHAWAFPAAIFARYFTLDSPELGMQFRTVVFQKQKDISPATLRSLAEQFAHDHGLGNLPSQIDADGKLLSLVQEDFDLGTKIGLQYVPLIFVISRNAGWVEVTDPTQLAAIIDNVRTKQRHAAR
jgi:protein-disulfide isomerase